MLRETERYESFRPKARPGEFDSGGYRRLMEDGREVWLRATYNPVLDGHGRPASVRTIDADVTLTK